MEKSEIAVSPVDRRWRPLAVAGLTTAAILLFALLAFLTVSVDRTLGSAAHGWSRWALLLLPDVHLDVLSLLLVPLGIVFTSAATFAAELADVGWERSALRRVLFLETGTSRTDFFYFLLRVSGLMYVLGFVLTFGLVFALANTLGRWFGFNVLASVDSFALQFIVVVLVNSLVFYWTHRLMHTGWLFEIHKVHHSALELNVLTPLRNHPVDFVITTLINSVPAALLGARPAVVSAYLLVNGLYQSAVHSEIRFLERPFIRALIVTPAVHKVHHSNSPRHYGTNYGVLTVWEVLFGTYHPPVTSEPMVLGVDNNESFNTDRPLQELVSVLTRWIGIA